MLKQSKIFKALAWICIMLTANVCTYEIGLAQDENPGEPPVPGLTLPVDPAQPDTLGVTQGGNQAVSDTIEPNRDLLTFPMRGVLPAHTDQPVYRKWWFWAITTVLITTSVILVTSGSERESREELPDFPEPPER